MKDFKTNQKPKSGELKNETISQEEKKRNKEATNFACACVGLEGFVFSEFEKTLFERLDNGEIGDEGFLSLIHEHCGIKPQP